MRGVRDSLHLLLRLLDRVRGQINTSLIEETMTGIERRTETRITEADRHGEMKLGRACSLEVRQADKQAGVTFREEMVKPAAIHRCGPGRRLRFVIVEGRQNENIVVTAGLVSHFVSVLDLCCFFVSSAQRFLFFFSLAMIVDD